MCCPRFLSVECEECELNPFVRSRRAREREGVLPQVPRGLIWAGGWTRILAVDTVSLALLRGGAVKRDGEG
jgi:hypothetical protein